MQVVTVSSSLGHRDFMKMAKILLKKWYVYSWYYYNTSNCIYLHTGSVVDWVRDVFDGLSDECTELPGLTYRGLNNK